MLSNMVRIPFPECNVICGYKPYLHVPEENIERAQSRSLTVCADCRMCSSFFFASVAVLASTQAEQRQMARTVTSCTGSVVLDED